MRVSFQDQASQLFGSFLEIAYARVEGSSIYKSFPVETSTLLASGFVFLSPLGTLSALSAVRFFQNSTEWPDKAPYVWPSGGSTELGGNEVREAG